MSSAPQSTFWWRRGINIMKKDSTTEIVMVNICTMDTTNNSKGEKCDIINTKIREIPVKSVFKDVHRQHIYNFTKEMGSKIN